jgi:hypothetical protein
MKSTAVCPHNIIPAEALLTWLRIYWITVALLDVEVESPFRECARRYFTSGCFASTMRALTSLGCVWTTVSDADSGHARLGNPSCGSVL